MDQQNMDLGARDLPMSDSDSLEFTEAGPSSTPSHRPDRPISSQVLRILTATQNTSALVFSAFLGVHLASPLAAAFLGGSGADKTMVRSLSPLILVIH